MVKSTNPVKILFYSDTHLGFDYAIRPRVEKVRRGPDFFANHEQVIDHAIAENVDAVIHGGDLFFRSKVHYSIVDKTFASFFRLTDKGIPVYLVPGNHERSWIPRSLFNQHELIYIFDQPRTFFLKNNELTLSLSGFPNVRKGIRAIFPEILKKIQFDGNVNFKILCMHQSVDGAKIGPKNYTFQYDRDTISANDLDNRFNLILSGHIHRHQVLKNDLQGNKLSGKIFYAGSTERTSFAEINEEKGFILFDIYPRDSSTPQVDWNFIQLPTRPMHILDLDIEGIKDEKQLAGFIDFKLRQLQENAQVQIHFSGKINDHLKNMVKRLIKIKCPGNRIISYRGQK